MKLDDFYALHPKLSPLLPAWREGRLGAVQAVGTDNPTGSHFEAQDQVEHGEGFGKRVGSGWIGRYLRTRGGAGALSGVAIGPTIPESLRGAGAASAFHSIDEIRTPGSDASSAGDPARTAAIGKALSDLYAAESGLLGQQGKETLDLLKRVENLRGKPYVPATGAEYPSNGFGNGLREVARLIKAEVGLEVASLDLDGWDTHFFQGTTGGLQAGLIDTLACGLAAFDADLKDAPHRGRVTTVVLTEFGRRLYENGSAGTDHGRGFAMFAMGAKVNGGKAHGEWPGLDEPGDLTGLLGPGGMAVKVDYRSVLSEVLAGAMGAGQVDKVFPGFTPQRVGLVG